VVISLETNKRYQHWRWLQEIANEIPPLNETANIHLLIGRDASELLKVQEFRNGPKGTPLGTKAFFKLDNNRPDALRSRWRPHVHACPPYQSLTGQLHQLKAENSGTAVLRGRSVP